jgi:HEAT repeat protein
LHSSHRAAAITGLAEVFKEDYSLEALEAVVAALSDADTQVREAAAAALPLLSSDLIAKNISCARSVLEPLLSSLRDSAWHVRAGALRALPELLPSLPEICPLEHSAALQRIARCLEDPEWVVRTAAVAALSRSVGPGKGDAAVRASAAILTHQDRKVREAAGDALVELAVSNAESVEREVASACSHDDSRVRRAGLQVLVQIAEHIVADGEMRAFFVKVALARLDDPVGSVRESALHALGHLASNADQREVGLVMAIAPRLDDGDPHVRAAAATAMQSATERLDKTLLPELLFFESPAVLHRSMGLQQSHGLGKGSGYRELPDCSIS